MENVEINIERTEQNMKVFRYEDKTNNVSFNLNVEVEKKQAIVVLREMLQRAYFDLGNLLK